MIPRIHTVGGAEARPHAMLRQIADTPAALCSRMVEHRARVSAHSADSIKRKG
jgi:hypothetical protein